MLVALIILVKYISKVSNPHKNAKPWVGLQGVVKIPKVGENRRGHIKILLKRDFYFILVMISWVRRPNLSY
ncbi:hypothetical protein DHD08_00720 [Arenibacter sp. H213]|nr:hypothetical protein [Arenibacter sp. H213]